MVLGFDDLDGYLAGHPYFGAIVGRYGNRIARADLLLSTDRRTTSRRTTTDNHLHGGESVSTRALWRAQPLANADGPRASTHRHQRRW